MTRNTAFRQTQQFCYSALMALSFAVGASTVLIAPAQCESERKKESAPQVMSLTERMKPVKELKTVDDLSRWMTYYYVHPQPEFIVPAIILADKSGLLEGDSVAPFQAFLSGVFEKNPERITEWFTQLGSIKDGSKTVILTAIYWTNSKEAKTLLTNIAGTLPEKAKVEFHKQIDKPAESLDKLPIDSPDVLDILWGAFSATGDEKYVKRLMSTLTWSDHESKDLNKMLIASAASWSLSSNVDQHPKVKEICQSVRSKEPTMKAYIDRVFADAAKSALQAKEKAKAAKMTAESESNRN